MNDRDGTDGPHGLDREHGKSGNKATDKEKDKDKDAKEPLRVGVAVRKRRRALHLTLAAVSARSGLSVPFLSQIENERARPSMRSLERVADALETTAVELLAASDTARTVDLVRVEATRPGSPRCRAYGPWCVAITSCTPWSSPGTRTRAASTSTATTS